MTTLVIVLCCVVLASASEGDTVRDLLETAKAAANDSIKNMECRVQKHLRPNLVKNAEHRIADMLSKATDFADKVWMATLNASLQVEYNIVEPARHGNVNFSECDRLYDDLLSSTNGTLSKANYCTAETVKTMKQFIEKIEWLTQYVRSHIWNIRSRIFYLVDETVDVDVAFTNETIAMLEANANSTLNEYLPKLKRKINKLKRLLNDHRVSDCLTNNTEYSIYNNTLSTYYEKSVKCVHEKTFKRLKATNPEALADVADVTESCSDANI